MGPGVAGGRGGGVGGRRGTDIRRVGVCLEVVAGGRSGLGAELWKPPKLGEFAAIRLWA